MVTDVGDQAHTMPGGGGSGEAATGFRDSNGGDVAVTVVEPPGVPSSSPLAPLSRGGESGGDDADAGGSRY
jgi:hypothetical protein